MNVIADVIGSLDAGGLAILPSAHEIGGEPRLLERAERIGNDKFAKRQAGHAAIIAENLKRERLGKAIRRKSAQGFVARAFVVFKNAAREDDGFQAALLAGCENGGKIQGVVAQRAQRVEVRAAIISDVRRVMAE